MKTITILLCCFVIQIDAYAQSVITVKKKKSKWALVQGNKKITEYSYDYLEKISDHLFITQVETHYGLINSTGLEIVPPRYESIEYLYGEYLKVKLNDQYGIIDLEGNIIVEISYQDVDSYSNSTALVKYDNEWMYIKDKQKQEAEYILFVNIDTPPLFKKCNTCSAQRKERYAFEQLLKFTYEHLKYPDPAKQYDIQGIVVVSFIITKEGKIGNPMISRDIGGGCGEAVLDVLHLMDSWTPATRDGEPVASRFSFPIRFKLD